MYIPVFNVHYIHCILYRLYTMHLYITLLIEYILFCIYYSHKIHQTYTPMCVVHTMCTKQWFRKSIDLKTLTKYKNLLPFFFVLAESVIVSKVQANSNKFCQLELAKIFRVEFLLTFSSTPFCLKKKKKFVNKNSV